MTENSHDEEKNQISVKSNKLIEISIDSLKSHMIYQ